MMDSPLQTWPGLAMDRRDTRAVYGDLLSPDLLDWHAKPTPRAPCRGPGALAPPWLSSPRWPAVCGALKMSLTRRGQRGTRLNRLQRS
jgi:hypothetical protein